MKILIVNEKKYGGGCEVFVKNLCGVLKSNGVHVFTIYLSGVEEQVEDNELLLNLNTSSIAKFSFSFKVYKKIRKILEDYRPDYVLVNNIFSSPLTVYAALHGENNIQIVHDYSIVCPKSTCVTEKNNICAGFRRNKCLRLCTYHNSKVVLIIKLVLMKLVKLIQNNVIKKYISPSKRLSKYIKDNGLPCEVLPNLQYLDIVDCKEHNGIRRFVYIGGLNKNKGLYDMLSTFCKFLEIDQNAILDIYGGCSTDGDYDFVKRHCNNRIVYHGHVAHSEVKNILKDAYALLVPSFWMENYPTTILEGFANRVLCIGSDRGGIPELLADGRGICFAYGQEGLLVALKKANNISEEEYNQITDRGVNYLRENNLPDIYYKRLSEILGNVKYKCETSE